MLTDAKIRAAKPSERPVKLFDSGGLYLEVVPPRGPLVAPQVPRRGQGEAAVAWRLPAGVLEGSP